MQYGRRPEGRPQNSDNRQRADERQQRRNEYDRSSGAGHSQNGQYASQTGYTYGRDPRRQNPPRGNNGYTAGRGDPRRNGSGAPRQNPRGSSYYGGYDPRRQNQHNGYSQNNSYGRAGWYYGTPPRGRGGQNTYRDPRAEAYIRQRREAEIRAERARRAEYERRRAVAREARRRLEEQLKRERKMRRKRQRKIFFGRALVCIIIFALLAVASGIFLALHFNLAPDTPPNRVTYTFGGAEKRTADSGDAFRNDNVYVCFNDVADYLGLSVTGDTDSMKFVFTDDDSIETGSAGAGTEDSVTFMMDSRTVVINSQTMTLPSESFLYGETVWVTVGFIDEFIEGLTVTQDGNTIAVSRIEDPALSTEDEPVYLDVSLKLKAADPIPVIDDGEDENSAATDIPVEFTTDLAAYEEYMNPENAEEYLVLVNTVSRVDGTYAPTDLTEVTNTRQDGREMQYLRNCAAKALEALFIEMQAAGYTDVSVMSGYRSYESQEYLHNYYIEQEMAADPTLTREAAKAIVTTYSAEAGTSEHQTGLCVDMHNLASATTEFAAEEAYTWLSENAWKFGFILRFPEDKTELTGISFEPWHWRFVGRTAAKAIHDGGLCFEEYVNNSADV